MTTYQHSPGTNKKRASALQFILQLAAVVALGVGAFSLVITAAGWYNQTRVDSYEQALARGEARDDQTTVIELPLGDGSGRTGYYKLGTSDYANDLRRAGIGCRLLSNGSILRFDSLRPGNVVPENVVARVTSINGYCDGKNQPGINMDRAQAFQ